MRVTIDLDESTVRVLTRRATRARKTLEELLVELAEAEAAKERQYARDNAAKERRLKARVWSEQGMTQAEIAKELGISRARVGQILGGERYKSRRRTGRPVGRPRLTESSQTIGFRVKSMEAARIRQQARESGVSTSRLVRNASLGQTQLLEECHRSRKIESADLRRELVRKTKALRGALELVDR